MADTLMSYLTRHYDILSLIIAVVLMLMFLNCFSWLWQLFLHSRYSTLHYIMLMSRKEVYSILARIY